MILVLVDEMDVDVSSRNTSFSMFDSFLTPLVLMLVERGIQLQIKEKTSLKVKQRGIKLQKQECLLEISFGCQSSAALLSQRYLQERLL